MPGGGPPGDQVAGEVTPPRRVLHVVVGHSLPTYFLNAVRSVQAVAPDDDLLVIDNASPEAELKEELARLAEVDKHLELVLRGDNDLERNGKVGSLYAACTMAFEYAVERDYDFVHLMQGDYQMLWWSAEFMTRAVELFDAHPQCVNIFTTLMSRDKLLGDALEESASDGVLKLAHYGLTDTGLYDLERWQEFGMTFADDEMLHARRYLDQGLEVLCHPWPLDASIPWPAVIRWGARKGREVRTNKPFLLKPLSADAVARVMEPGRRTWREDVCVPWGWICLTPMWGTGLDSIDFWVCRYRDAKRNGLSHMLPRLELRGVGWRDLMPRALPLQYRPSLLRLFVVAPARETWRRLRGLAATPE